MPKRRSDSTLGAVGEWGFLNRLLPRLGRLAPGRFLVPPGDDAAVLSADRAVLSIDGLTEGTHFRPSWARRLKSVADLSLPRALGWKLVGSCASDLAAMGETDRRWAMIYLGAPKSVRLSFLDELQAGTADAARRFGLALAGGDTVRAAQLTMVAAVGARLTARKPLVRTSGRPGQLLCVAGTVGDAAAGLAVLEGRKRGLTTAEQKYFAVRMFWHEPMFDAAARLSRGGVTCGMDVSDALSDCIGILCAASGVGAAVEIGKVPVSAPFARHFTRLDALSGGEDYALLFAADAAVVRRLEKDVDVAVIGRLAPRAHGVRYTFHGLPAKPRRAFAHF